MKTTGWIAAIALAVICILQFFQMQFLSVQHERAQLRDYQDKLELLDKAHQAWCAYDSLQHENKLLREELDRIK